MPPNRRFPARYAVKVDRSYSSSTPVSPDVGPPHRWRTVVLIGVDPSHISAWLAAEPTSEYWPATFPTASGDTATLQPWNADRFSRRPVLAGASGPALHSDDALTAQIVPLPNSQYEVRIGFRDWPALAAYVEGLADRLRTVWGGTVAQATAGTRKAAGRPPKSGQVWPLDQFAKRLKAAYQEASGFLHKKPSQVEVAARMGEPERPAEMRKMAPSTFRTRLKELEKATGLAWPECAEELSKNTGGNSLTIPQ